LPKEKPLPPKYIAELEFGKKQVFDASGLHGNVGCVGSTYLRTDKYNCGHEGLISKETHA